MYSRWQVAGKYLHYYLSASNGKGHGTHSPFIFQFITRILNDRQQYPEYRLAEELRSRMLEEKRVLTLEDFGAGSSVSKTNQRTIAAVAKKSAKPPKFGQLLFRMVRAYQPKCILELGTSLGITTSYLCLAKPAANLITMEGAGEVAAVAKENFAALQLQHCSLIEGNFDQTLPGVLGNLSVLDFAFIDGNHRQEPTERYFNQLLAKTHNDSVLVFDDIHWSREMEQAWDSIKNHSSVRYTIDLFFIGIVFFRGEFREKQHFTIRF